MSKAELEKKLDERLKGWKRLANGQIAYTNYIDSAVFPMAGNLLAFAVRFEGRKTGPDDRKPAILQLGLSPRQCRHIAKQLLDGADSLEKMNKPTGRPN